MSEPDNRIKQELMLGLIYPAVLGSIFYTTLGEIGHQLAGFGETGSLRSLFEEGSALLAVKFSLLIIAVGFYFCDYLYILFTNRYQDRFFRYDLLFVATMYAAFAAIGMSSKGDAPSWAKLMLIYYLFFMVLYRKWDKSEVGVCKNRAERLLFKKVVKWENLSIIGISACFIFIVALETWVHALAAWLPGLLVGLTMAIVTLYFFCYAWAKRRFSERFPRKVRRKKMREGTPNPGPQAVVTSGAVPTG